MSEGRITETVNNIITSSPYTIYLSCILASLISGDYKYVLFGAFVIFFGDMCNAMEKKIFKAILPDYFGKRPSGCGNSLGKKCSGCGIYPSRKVSKTWGMPSGHTQIITLTAVFWTIYLVAMYKHEQAQYDAKNIPNPPNQGTLITQLIFIWLLTVIICAQRVYSKCHNLIQIAVGAAFGAGFGVLVYFICSKISNEKFPTKF